MKTWNKLPHPKHPIRFYNATREHLHYLSKEEWSHQSRHGQRT